MSSSAKKRGRPSLKPILITDEQKRKLKEQTQTSESLTSDEKLSQTKTKKKSEKKQAAALKDKIDDLIHEVE